MIQSEIMSKTIRNASQNDLPISDLRLRSGLGLRRKGSHGAPGIGKWVGRPGLRIVAAGIAALVMVVGLACGGGDGATSTALPVSTATNIPAPTATRPLFVAPTATRIPTPIATRVVSPTARLSSNPAPTRVVAPTRAPFLTPTIFAQPTRTPIPAPTRTPLPTPTRTPFVPRTQVSSSAPTATPFSPTSTLATGPTSTPIGSTQTSGTSSATMSFEHTGTESKVYLDVGASAGTTVTATLTGPSVTSSTVRTTVAGSSGQVRLTWTVDRFGEYTVTGTAGATPISSSVQVQ